MSDTTSDNLADCTIAAFDRDLVDAIEKLQMAEDRLAPLGPKLVLPSSLHDENGAPLWISSTASRLLGLKAVECSQSNVVSRSLNFLSAINVQDRVNVVHFLAAELSDDDVESAEFRCLDSERAGLKAQWIEVSRSSFLGSNSGKRFVLATYRDVSKTKQNEIDAIQLKKKNEEADVAKSRFLANISHELRTPLNAILGFSELLGSPSAVTFDDQKKTEYVGLIHESAKHLLNLLNCVLDMSKIENGMYEVFLESFCLGSSLEKTVAIMRGQAELRGIRLQLCGHEDLPEVIADERAIRQIVINLISNAIKFSDDNSLVQVKARRFARTVELSVSDNGIGISREHLPELGKPFFQADSKYDRKYEGTGLGLSVVRGLIELHGGNVRFASERGRGTKVTVTFPINGKSGRQVPASEEVRSVVSINREGQSDPSGLRILRNTA